MLHIRKISIYFLKDDVKEDYVHDQIMKIVVLYKKSCSDLKELVVFYRELLEFLQIQDLGIQNSGFFSWIQDYVDLAQEVFY